MSQKLSQVLVGTGVCVAFLAGSLALTQEQGARRPAAAGGAPVAVGLVTAYEADKSLTVEIRQRGGQTRKAEFNLDKEKTKIELRGDAKAVAVGVQVSVFADKDNPKAAARIVAGIDRPAAPPRGQPRGEPAVGGTLQGVDVAKNTVTVTTSNRATGKLDKSFEMAKDVVILRDGKPAKLSDLKQGGRVSVKLSPDQKTAVSISETGKTLGSPLKSVDPENNTITITTLSGARGEEAVKKDVTHQLAKDGKVTLEGKEVTLADLKDVRPGSNIQLTFSVDDEKKLVHIQYAPGRR